MQRASRGMRPPCWWPWPAAASKMTGAARKPVSYEAVEQALVRL
jgi:hypothetical protein